MKDGLERLIVHIAIGVIAVIVIATLAGGDGKDLAAVNDFVSGRASKLLDYAAVVAAVGTVAMALVELIKALADVRRWYHEWKLRQWVSGKEALEDLLYLSIGDRSRSDALCGQPLEKMMGQIQAAANAALDFPAVYPSLFNFLAATDVKLPASLRRPGPPDLAAEDQDRAADDRSAWMNFVQGRKQPPAAAAMPPFPPSSPMASPLEQEASRARLRLSNLVARKLDGFQLRTQYYWDRGNQLAAVVASVGIMYYALSLTNLAQGLTLHGLLLGLFSGALAPFAKDLTRSLGQFSKP